MNIQRTISLRWVVAAILSACVSCFAGVKDKTLEVYWTDVEGGAATLIVTPNGESILVDSGNPSSREPGRVSDAVRINKTLLIAGVTNLDYYVTTHFHADHYGGIAELAKLIPVSVVIDNGIPTKNPDGGNDATFLQAIKPYSEFKATKRAVIHAGEAIPLMGIRGAGAPKLSLTCLAAMQNFIKLPTAPANHFANTAKEKDPDTSDNKNSIVLVLRYGAFDMYLGGDLTWNMETKLVAPQNLVGIVDVYQVTHHGLDISNNPLVLQALQPSVAVMSNGTSKGCEPGTFATLKNTPSIRSIFQMHKNLRRDFENNTDKEHIANIDAKCDANYIKLTVAPDGWRYTIGIPATGFVETFATK